MILDTMERADAHRELHPGFAAAFAFLRQSDLAKLETGRHKLDGDRLHANVERCLGRGRSGARLEAHRRYIDIQYTLSGAEEIGWKPLELCELVYSPFDENADIGFFRDPPQAWVPVPPGSFAIFRPEDAHAPLAGVGSLHKVIVKVAVRW